jgi:phospholipase C
VPAVVISPWIPRNLVDHRLYDHASIPATLEALFGLDSLTRRDAQANRLTTLLSLASPRDDAPASPPAPAESGIAGCPPVDCSGIGLTADAATAPAPVSRPNDSINDGNLPGIVHAALRSDLAVPPPAQRQNILARVSALKTREDAAQYLEDVGRKLRHVV